MSFRSTVNWWDIPMETEREREYLLMRRSEGMSLWSPLKLSEECRRESNNEEYMKETERLEFFLDKTAPFATKHDHMKHFYKKKKFLAKAMKKITIVGHMTRKEKRNKQWSIANRRIRENLHH